MKENSKNIKKLIWLLVFILIAVSTLAIISLNEEEEEISDVPIPPNLYSSSHHVIGTGNTLGTYFAAGKLLEKWFNDNIDKNGGSFKAFQTNGSIDNIVLLQTKRIEFGMSEARIAKEAYSSNPKIRVVWPLWYDVVQMVKPPVDLVPNYVFPGDVKGFIGQKNSSTARTSKEIFEALNITGNRSVDVPIGEVVKKIGDANIGFAMIQAGMPNRTVADSLIFYHCGLVSFDDKQIDLICNKVSTSVKYTIPAGYYEENQPEIQTIAIPNVLVTTSDISPELVEYVTEMLIKGCSRLKYRFKAFETVPTDSESILKILRETGVPLHEGTRRWLDKNLNHLQNSENGGLQN
ncbi:MAG: TAXI family TRAP transporter solute-binding subunit [Candidatus Riflebacteria bacterium]|nr:TAXI family TRAP transporter solute-binding subunit [Candidatus Riflebacteria bacterium]